MRLSCWAVTLRCIDHKMDKAKTKQRREGEWCHLTCHSDSSTTQNRRIKSYQTPSKDFSSTKRRWQRPKVAPQPLLAMNSHLTGTQIKSERKKESHLLKFRLFEFGCLFQPTFSGCRAVLNRLWLRLSPAQGWWNGRGASGATDFARDNSKPRQSHWPKNRKCKEKRIGMCLMY